MNARILAVNVGMPEEVVFGNRIFTTSILKSPVEGPVAIRGINLDGDDQADRTVHGGPSKAVYAYASEDYAWWAEHGIVHPFGRFGENLTTEGVDLRTVRIGERWRAGTALLEASEPRVPCYKLGYAAGDPRFPKIFAQALRYGSYFRIIEEGDARAGDAFVREYLPDDHDVTVAEVARIRMFAPHERAKLANVEGLALHWRGWAQTSDEALEDD